jgi:hypothetical protein
MKTETTFEVRIAHKQEQAAGICSLELRALEGAAWRRSARVRTSMCTCLVGWCASIR